PRLQLEQIAGDSPCVGENTEAPFVFGAGIAHGTRAETSADIEHEGLVGNAHYVERLHCVRPDDQLHGLLRCIWNRHGAGEYITGTKWQNAQTRVGLPQAIDDAGHGPIATGGDHELDPAATCRTNHRSHIVVASDFVDIIRPAVLAQRVRQYL